MPEAPAAHLWHPIAALSEADLSATDDHLPALMSAWREVRADLSEQQVEDFNERLNREWAIETGMIEGLYTLERGTTQLLIERGLDASLIPSNTTGKSPQLVVNFLRSHTEAVDWLFEIVRSEQPLSTWVIRELHALLTRAQEHVDGADPFGRPTRVKLEHGRYKRLPNNPTRSNGSVHEYCPPEQVASEMDRLIEMHSEHLQRQPKVPASVAAAWLHHRFTQIHPFQDGNGRVARALATLVFIEAGLFPLVVDRDDRPAYIDALEEADAGSLAALIRLFERIEQRWLLQAVSIAREIKHDARRLDQMVEAIADQFGARNVDRQAYLEQAKNTADNLHDLAYNRFTDLADQLMGAIENNSGILKIFADEGRSDDHTRRVWNRYQVIKTARHFSYYANFRDHQSWVRLGFNTENGRSEILLSFHSVGHDYRGVVAASMCFYRRPQSGDGAGHLVTGHQSVGQGPFQFSHKEAANSAERRFEAWLEGALLEGLDLWRRGE